MEFLYRLFGESPVSRNTKELIVRISFGRFRTAWRSDIAQSIPTTIFVLVAVECVEVALIVRRVLHVPREILGLCVEENGFMNSPHVLRPLRHVAFRALALPDDFVYESCRAE